jgi:6-phosphofructokinase 1
MASGRDLEESYQLGLKGAALGLEQKSGEMAVVRRISDTPYTVAYEGADVTLIANKEKKVPDAWINQAGNDVTEEMVAYLSPLVEGEVQVPMVNGIPHYLFLPKDK